MKAPTAHRDPPLVAHIVFRFDYGGLENGVANVVNALSGQSFRHAVIALTEVTEFRDRLIDDVQVFALGKKPGKDLGAYRRLYGLLRRLKPVVVHTRNIGTLDCLFIAFLARVPIRIHGEHGWDVLDPDGTRPKYRWLRRILSLFVHQFVTVSEDLRTWLVTVVGIGARKVTHIYNGVDTQRFRPRQPTIAGPLPTWFNDPQAVVIGSVTRFSEIKDPLNLVEAFIELSARPGSSKLRVRLVMLGDGELRQQALTRLAAAELTDVAWLPGSRDDVADILPMMDIFVLASFREGISNTILEAMATGLPVVATDTGGNRELVAEGITGMLIPTADSGALAGALAKYLDNERLREAHGSAARARAVEHFSIASMIANYGQLYATRLAAKGI